MKNTTLYDYDYEYSDAFYDRLIKQGLVGTVQDEDGKHYLMPTRKGHRLSALLQMIGGSTTLNGAETCECAEEVEQYVEEA